MDDYYLVEEHSDNESCSSSGDLHDNDLALFMDSPDDDSSSSDAGNEQDRQEEELDFETEMNREREARMRSSSRRSREAERERDMDVDDGQSSSGGRSRSASATRSAAPTNDDLLYDPDADDLDQKWIDRKRAGHSRRRVASLDGALHSNDLNQDAQGRSNRKLPNSDAVLNCPGCMSLLSLDCQRHETYKTQYRAMFVFNCQVDSEQPFQFQQKAEAKKKKRYGRQAEPNFQADERIPATNQPDAGTAGTSLVPRASDIYYNVNCAICKTQIAVYDCDEVFHFFNVLASYT